MSQARVRTALVTGGATGIGAAITLRLANEGMNVFVVQRDDSEASQGSKAFRDQPSATKIHVAGHDLSTGPGCAEAVAHCASRFGGLEILVNNAAVTGEAAVGALARCDDAHIDQVVDVNLKAPLRLAREALPHLQATHGVIVNISSVAQMQAQAETPAYVASKAGLGGLTRALGYDLASHGIRVVGIAPGDIDTATSRRPSLLSKRAHIAGGKQTPLGYAAEPDDVANAVAWVVSDQARYVTATTIVVDGGLTAY